MNIREHASQHDAIADLPLVTESATVTDVTQMDRDRRAEVREAMARWLDERGIAHQYTVGTTPEEWTSLETDLARDGHAGLARTVATLAERAARPKPMLVRVQFQTEREFQYLAGQYVGIRYDGTSRAYSIASSPNQDTVEICVRRVPDGRLSPRICRDLAVGDDVTLRGPHGELVLQDHSPRDMAFLATGTGVAPFKGMIDYVFEEGLDEYGGTKRDVWLFVGGAWRDDVPYYEAFRERAKAHENFHFVPTLSREPHLSDWDGESDYVQHAFLKHVDENVVTAPLGKQLDRWLRQTPDSGVEARLDPTDVDVYACGINAMVYGLVGAAQSVGVPEERIESEGFG